MFGLPSKKDYLALKYDNKILNEQLEEAENSKWAWQRAAESAKEDMAMWRAKYELSQTNPEVKADIEGAFKRGALFAKQQLLNNIVVMAQGLNLEMPKEESDANV